MEETKNNVKQKKKINLKARAILVLSFILFVSIFMFVGLRGEYLNILQTGENYIQVFTQNINQETIKQNIEIL